MSLDLMKKGYMDFLNTMKVSSLAVNLVYLYVLINPETTADRLYNNWKNNKVFMEYNRPDINTINLWFADIYEELEARGIKKLN